MSVVGEAGSVMPLHALKELCGADTKTTENGGGLRQGERRCRSFPESNALTDMRCGNIPHEPRLMALPLTLCAQNGVDVGEIMKNCGE